MCVNKLFFELNNNLILFIFSFFFNIEQSYEYATSYRFKCQSNTHKESNESRYTMFQRRNNKDNRKKKKKKLDKYKCLQTLLYNNSHSWIQHICHFLIYYSTYVGFWRAFIAIVDLRSMIQPEIASSSIRDLLCRYV